MAQADMNKSCRCRSAKWKLPNLLTMKLYTYRENVEADAGCSGGGGGVVVVVVVVVAM